MLSGINENKYKEEVHPKSEVYTKEEVDTLLQEIKDILTPARFVIETWVDGTEGYRIWSDGYCEQWGFISVPSADTICTLHLAFRDTNYNVTLGGGTRIYGNTSVYTLTTSNFKCWTSDDSSFNSATLFWKASGYLPQEENI